MGVKMISKETQPDGTEVEVEMTEQVNNDPPLPKLEKYKNPSRPWEGSDLSQKE